MGRIDTETALAQVEALLKPWTRWSRREQPNLVTISVSRHHLLECVETLHQRHWGYLAAITGLHLPGVENPASEEKQWNRVAAEGEIHSAPPMVGDSFVVLYHFCYDDAILNLRVHPPSVKDAAVPSICGLIPSATLYERELQEMFGIRVEGTPDSTPLLLPDDWPAGVYPMRKQFTGLGESEVEEGAGHAD